MQNLVRNVCNMWQCLKQTTVDITVCCLTVFISLSLIDTLVRRAGMRHPQPPLVPQNLKELPTKPIQQLNKRIIQQCQTSIHQSKKPTQQLQKTDTAAQNTDTAAHKTDKTNSSLYLWELPGVLGSPVPPGTPKPLTPNHRVLSALPMYCPVRILFDCCCRLLSAKLLAVFCPSLADTGNTSRKLTRIAVK